MSLLLVNGKYHSSLVLAEMTMEMMVSRWIPVPTETIFVGKMEQTVNPNPLSIKPKLLDRLLQSKNASMNQDSSVKHDPGCTMHDNNQGDGDVDAQKPELMICRVVDVATYLIKAFDDKNILQR